MTRTRDKTSLCEFNPTTFKTHFGIVQKGKEAIFPGNLKGIQSGANCSQTMPETAELALLFGLLWLSFNSVLIYLLTKPTADEPPITGKDHNGGTLPHPPGSETGLPSFTFRKDVGMGIIH